MRPPELACRPDAELVCRRMELWWEKEILDRPAIQVIAPGPHRFPIPESFHRSLRDRWMDTQYQADRARAIIQNMYFAGEALPFYMPDLGPELLSAAYGCELEFGEETSWSIPCLRDLSQAPDLRFDPENVYIRKIVEITSACLEAGKGIYLTGMADIHAGADLAAALRDHQQLCLDLADSGEDVHKLLETIRPAFFEIYNLLEAVIRGTGQTLMISWLPLFSPGRYYIPSCDFSAMISPGTFAQFFLPELIDEIEWLDRSIYHLDGPRALCHLDTILAIPGLDAVQFVPGAGSMPAATWIPVCRRIQDAGKNIHMQIEPHEIDQFMEALSPEGVMLSITASSVEEADWLVQKTRGWKSKRRQHELCKS